MWSLIADSFITAFLVDSSCLPWLTVYLLVFGCLTLCIRKKRQLNDPHKTKSFMALPDIPNADAMTTMKSVESKEPSKKKETETKTDTKDQTVPDDKKEQKEQAAKVDAKKEKEPEDSKDKKKSDKEKSDKMAKLKEDQTQPDSIENEGPKLLDEKQEKVPGGNTQVDEGNLMSGKSQLDGTKMMTGKTQADGTKMMTLKTQMDGTKMMTVKTQVDETKMMGVKTQTEGTKMMAVKTQTEGTKIMTVNTQVDEAPMTAKTQSVTNKSKERKTESQTGDEKSSEKNRRKKGDTRTEDKEEKKDEKKQDDFVISVPEIAWGQEVGQTVFKMTNSSGKRFAYKIKVSNADVYSVDPVRGILDDKESAEVTVVRSKGAFNDDQLAIVFCEANSKDVGSAEAFQRGATSQQHKIIPMLKK